MRYSIKYPRRRLVRSLFRRLARGLFPLLARTHISGLEKFPARGPLIVIGNHTGAIEVALMAAFSPRAPEFLGSMDIPPRGWIETVIEMYGPIPVYRGYPSSRAMRMGLDVLHQSGILGIFPEGGIWEPGRQKSQTGAAWLSSVARAPVLPIGFGDTRGKMAAAFRFQHPAFEMNVGDLLPPVRLERALPRKEALQQAADRLMDAVWALVPEQERRRKETRPENERFSLEIRVFDPHGQPIPIPPALAVRQGAWISRFAHRPNLIGTLRDNLSLPVQVLKELQRRPPAGEIHLAARAVREYVEKENPQYFNFRYGYQDGRAFLDSFCQLQGLMEWVMQNAYRVEAEVRYEYTDPYTGEQRVLTVPEETVQW